MLCSSSLLSIDENMQQIIDTKPEISTANAKIIYNIYLLTFSITIKYPFANCTGSKKMRG
jgi:hypothetical protein